MLAHDSYLIVGAGLFGATTALALRRRFPSVKVTLLDPTPFPNPSAATCDLNKIIRADYEDTFYMRLGLEAQEEWRHNPIFKPFYHESGSLYATEAGTTEGLHRAYRKIGVTPASRALSEIEARSMFGGVFRDAMWDGAEDFYYNPRNGWGEGAGALQSAVQAAVDSGVEFREGRCSSLIIGSDGNCQGAALTDGSLLHADRIVVAAGAWTPWLLAESAPNDPKLHVGDRMIAAGAIQCRASYPDSEAHKLDQVPVLANVLKHTLGESIPPTKEGWLKFNYETSFTNVKHHQPSSQDISVPPSEPSQSTWSDDVPDLLKSEIERVVAHTYGRYIKGIQVEQYRMCWDAITPEQDWIISPHPHCGRLYVAAGGSFHSWKFMPVIGSYVVKMLMNELDEELSARWAWDHQQGGHGGDLPEYLPSRDLQELWEK